MPGEQKSQDLEGTVKTGIEVAKENPGYTFKREWRNGLLIVEGECRETGIKTRSIGKADRMREWFDSQDYAFGFLSEMAVDKLNVMTGAKASDALSVIIDALGVNNASQQ